MQLLDIIGYTPSFCCVRDLSWFITPITAAACWWQANICSPLGLAYPRNCWYLTYSQLSTGSWLDVANQILRQQLFMYIHRWSVMLPSSTQASPLITHVSLYHQRTFKKILVLHFPQCFWRGVGRGSVDLKLVFQVTHFTLVHLSNSTFIYCLLLYGFLKLNEWNHL